MIHLSAHTEALAKRLADAQNVTVEEAIRLALEERARAAGVADEPISAKKRLRVESMLAIGAEIAAMPILDPRSPQEIMDDLDSL